MYFAKKKTTNSLVNDLIKDLLCETIYYTETLKNNQLQFKSNPDLSKSSATENTLQ